jgi:pantothenate synthetase
MEHKLSQSEGVVLDYLRVVDPRTFLTPVDHASDDVLLVGAVKVGRTRLIDNIRLQRSEIGGGA